LLFGELHLSDQVLSEGLLTVDNVAEFSTLSLAKVKRGLHLPRQLLIRLLLPFSLWAWLLNRRRTCRRHKLPLEFVIGIQRGEIPLGLRWLLELRAFNSTLWQKLLVPPGVKLPSGTKVLHGQPFVPFRHSHASTCCSPSASKRSSRYLLHILGGILR
jgi:hypothetical protein